MNNGMESWLNDVADLMVGQIRRGETPNPEAAMAELNAAGEKMVDRFFTDSSFKRDLVSYLAPIVYDEIRK